MNKKSYVTTNNAFDFLRLFSKIVNLVKTYEMGHNKIRVFNSVKIFLYIGTSVIMSFFILFQLNSPKSLYIRYID